MATIQELIAQRSQEVGEFERKLTEQEKLLSASEIKLAQQKQTFLKQTAPIPLTLKRQSVLSKSFGAGGVGEGFKKIRRQKLVQREKTLPKFTKVRQEIETQKQKIASERARLSPIKKEIQLAREFERGRKLGRSGDPRAVFAVKTAEERRGFSAGRAIERVKEQKLALLKVGKPIFIDDKLIGFEKDQMSVLLELLSTEDLSGLEKVGVIRFEEKRLDLDPVTFDTLELSSVKLSRGFDVSKVEPFQQFARPEFEFKSFTQANIKAEKELRARVKTGIIAGQLQKPSPTGAMVFTGREVGQPKKDIVIRERRPSIFERGIGGIKTFLTSPTTVPITIIPGAKIKIPEVTQALKRDKEVPALVKDIAGFTEEIAGSPGDILKFAAPIAIGAGVGFGVKGAGALLTKIGPRTAAIGETGLGLAGLGAGGLFAFGRGQQIIAAPPGKRGAIVGVTTREVVGFTLGARLGAKGFTSIRDIVRTRGLIEIPAESVVAPEFFKGQRFPSIRRGQTAGELRSEFFKPIKAIGEVKRAPRGFTALATEPLKEIPKGDSFVFGGFSAPRVSPAFLRVKGGEERIKLVSFKGFLTGGKPTIVRTEFVDIGFVPGVTARTARPSGRVSTKILRFFGGGFKERTKELVVDFGKPQAPKGSAFIPFIKTEKEAITPFGTRILETGRKFFIKFEGRRIPIAEVTAIPEAAPLGTGLGTLGKGIKTLGGFLTTSSRIPQSSLITPEIGAISFLSSRPRIREVVTPSISRGRRPLTNLKTSFIPSSSKRPLSEISIPSSVPSRRRPIQREIISPLIEEISSFPRRRRPEPIISRASLPISSLPRIESRREKVRRIRKPTGRKPIKKPKKKKKKRRVKIRPSFTGIITGTEKAAEITKLGGVIDIGIAPGTIRGLKTDI